jgi:glycosyltransferase involved in cell wall biosynthesis
LNISTKIKKLTGEYDKFCFKSNHSENIVSVIVPTYNRCEYIKETLDSVYIQSYRPIELLIVDDGSGLETKGKLLKWASEHNTRGFSCRIFFEKHSGAPVARSKGIIESRGSYIQFLDSDDVLDSDKIRLQVEWLQKNPSYEMVLAAKYPLNCNNHIKPPNNDPIDPEQFLRTVVRRPWWQTMMPLFRKEAIVKAGPWHPDLQCCQDWEYFTRLVCLGVKYGFEPSAKCYVRGKDGRPRLSVRGKEKESRAMVNQVIYLESFWRHVPGYLKTDKQFRNSFVSELNHLAIWLQYHAEMNHAKRALNLSLNIRSKPINALNSVFIRRLNVALGMRTVGRLLTFPTRFREKFIKKAKRYYKSVRGRVGLFKTN